MNGVIYDARRIKAYEGMKKLGSYAGKSEEFVSKLWEALVLDTFAAMLAMKKEPGLYKKRLEEGRGMDRFL